MICTDHSPSVKIQRLFVAVLVALAVTGAAAACSVAFGARIVTLPEILDGLRAAGVPLPGTTNASSDAAHSVAALAVAERLPRTAIALAVGAALGVSGTLMQAVTRNPIADPGILGINHGAALGVILGMTLWHTSDLRITLWLALAGAFTTAFFVYLIGSLGPGGTTPIKLALAGVATTALLSSLVTAIRLPQDQALDEFRYWHTGSLGRGSWDTLGTVAPLLGVALLVGILCARALNSLALGDEAATALGVNVARTRIIAVSAGVALCAAATAVAGPISFVGLMVPHTLRALWGQDMRLILPLSAFGGAALLTFADVAGRIIGRPNEVAVGIITAFIGAPILIAIVRATKVRDL